ncbi:centrosomal protein of 164 kDa-like isoform X2 [Macrobrachium nipponense]|uniref:centrosomal protein of 164 kDa-like isoform X2 n=1 Tax=Macrobrachium nipponense TaxID=159736 RepID=UPI0030C8B448
MTENSEAVLREKHSCPSNVDDEDSVFSSSQQTILEEVFTSDYNITEEEVLEYCNVVGIDPSRESHLLPLARSALYQPVPRPWTPVEDAKAGLYFFNPTTGESSWNHPVDAIVRALVARDRNKSKSCGDSCLEDLNSEDDLISELLKGENSACDLTRSDCDSNHPSEYLTTALTLAEQCFNKTSAKSNDKSSVPLSVSCVNSDRRVSKLIRDEEGENGALDGRNDETECEQSSPSHRRLNGESEFVVTNHSENSDVSIASYVRANDNDFGVVTNKSPQEPPENTEPDEDYQSSVRLTPPDGAECDEVPGMLGSRDGSGRGLGRPTLGPPPLGTPPASGGLAPLGGPPPLGASAPLGGPSPLGRAPLGSAPLGGARIPPLGGHITPLAPIAAANKQGLQLSPLKSKPLGGSLQQPPPLKRDGSANPPLQRQAPHQEKKTGGAVRNPPISKNLMQNSGRQQGDGQSAAAAAAAVSSAAGSPPRSILKGPVIAGRAGPPKNQGVDRLAITQTKESKNIRFEFETEGMEFHSSEEDFEEELDEEELEEEEEYEDEEEEYDSEAEDPEEEAMLVASGYVDDDSELGGLVLNDASDLLPSGAGQQGKAPKISKINPVKPEDHKPKPTTPVKPKDIPTDGLKKQNENTLGQNQMIDKAPVRPKSAVNPQPTGKQQVNQTPQVITNKGDADKRSTEVRVPEERKLELEGTPKNRKVNPLDRVVAKLGGKTDKNNQVKADAAPAAPTVMKNLEVNLTELMKQDLSEEMKKLREEEEKRLRTELEQSVKLLQNQLNKEYEGQRDKLRKEHESAVQKLRDQEKDKLEAARKQIISKNDEEIKKVEVSFEKELSDKRRNVMKDLEEKHNKETESMKLAFVKEMQQMKEKLQREHEEEMQELQAELKSLYDKEKEAAQNAALTRNKAAAETAISDLERSMGEVLRERQANIRREHNKQLSILNEELEKELESAARQAKERETAEKQNHTSKLAKLKQEHEKSLQELQECHKEELELIEVQHRENIEKLKVDFKEELTNQKVQLENKLTELKIEYEQQMISFGNEHLEQIGNGEEREADVGNTGSEYNEEEEDSHVDKDVVKGSSDKFRKEDHKYDQILNELQERRKTLEHDLEDLKSKENKVRELKKKTVIPSTSCCSGPVCNHELKYNKMKAKYANLVSRIKSEKAKKSLQKMSADPDILASDKTTTESNTNDFDGGMQSEDVSSSIMSSPKHLHQPGAYAKSAENSSADEDLKAATKVFEKYGRVSDLGNARNISRSSVNLNIKSHSTRPLINIPRKAWMDDDLLVHGRRELIKAEKFLKSSQVKFPGRLEELQAEDIQREILRQNAGFEVHGVEGRARRLSLGHGGSLASDTEESDEITHDAPSSSSDFGLDQILAKISATSKMSAGDHHRSKSLGAKTRPIRAASSLERGLNKISEPFQTQSTGYNALSTSAPLRIEDLKIGSVPDLGPDTVDRIASINQYLQRRWTNYFGEMTVPLGGKAGWPTQVIGQSSLLVGKKNSPGFIYSGKTASDSKIDTALLSGITFKPGQQEDIDLTQKIEDLRSWLNNAQAISAAPKEV